MGIEPTRSLSPDPSPVLKTGPSTSYGHAPLGVGKRSDLTSTLGAARLQEVHFHNELNPRLDTHARSTIPSRSRGDREPGNHPVLADEPT